MRAFSLALCLALLSPAMAWAIDALPFKDRAEELRFQHLTRQLRCLVCQNESLADDFVLYDPPLRGATVLLWFGPLLVLLIGAAAVTRIVRKRAAIQHNTAPGKGTEEDW